ncbi:MAG: epoxyqueuosine reductase QueH [Ruminococcus sp.]|nr:epoxyqueuosine reductase QueH [Ruminococcus sp.]MBQ8725375.1 epoxyqueuosine reductase QueH [Oscillospiraceae bacterium]
MTPAVPKINYQIKMEQIIKRLPSDRTPLLFLHACCAPCSSYVLEALSRYFSIRLFFYNPNIFPEEEYQYRLSELRRLISELPLPNPVEVVDGTYEPQRFLALAKGLEQEPERGERCRRCIAHRLEETFRTAAKEGADFVTTTLSISPHKDAPFINETGEKLSEQYGVPWLFSDFKKKGGYLRSIALSETHHLYRQDFCGCVYSRAERERQKQAAQSS